MRKHRPEIVWTWLKELPFGKKLAEFPPKPFAGKWPTRLFVGEVNGKKLVRGLIVKPDAPGREFLRKSVHKWMKHGNMIWLAEFDRAGVLTYTWANPPKSGLGNMVTHARRAIELYYPFNPPATLLSSWKEKVIHERVKIAGRLLSVYSFYSPISRVDALAIEKKALAFYPELKQ